MLSSSPITTFHCHTPAPRSADGTATTYSSAGIANTTCHVERCQEVYRRGRESVTCAIYRYSAPYHQYGMRHWSISMACDISPVASRQDASDGVEQRSVATICKENLRFTHNLSTRVAYQLGSYRLYSRKREIDLPGFGLTRNWFSLVNLWKDKASHR